MKKIYLVFIIAITILLYSCGNSSNKENKENSENTENKEVKWNGTWEYSMSEDDTPIWVRYAISIDGEDCKIEADGFSFGCYLNCRGEVKGDEYVFFYKNEPADADNICYEFDKTEPLIILTEKNGFLIVKESQLYCLGNKSKVVFEKANTNTTSNTETDPIVLIKERFKIINDNVASYSKKSKRLEEGEGGDVIGYYEGNDLKKMAVKGYGSMGFFTFEYYFWDGELFFLFETENYYDVDDPGGKVDQKIERRYYFNNSKIIKWLDNDKKEVESSKFKEEEEKINERVISLKSEL